MDERSFLHQGQTGTKCFDPLSGREPGSGVGSGHGLCVGLVFVEPVLK